MCPEFTHWFFLVPWLCLPVSHLARTALFSGLGLCGERGSEEAACSLSSSSFSHGALHPSWQGTLGAAPTCEPEKTACLTLQPLFLSQEMPLGFQLPGSYTSTYSFGFTSLLPGVWNMGKGLGSGCCHSSPNLVLCIGGHYLGFWWWYHCIQNKMWLGNVVSSQHLPSV